MFGKITTTEKKKKIITSSVLLGCLVIVANLMFLRNMPLFGEYFPLINVVGSLVILGPLGFLKYIEYQKNKEIEERFPDFLRNVTEGIKSGMTLPRAIEEAADSGYGILDPYVKKMSSQIDWGVPFDEVLRRFADKVGSVSIDRTVTTIIEAHRSGGNVSEVLEVVGESVKNMERLKKERKSHVYSQVVTGYMIYFVFLGVMIGLQRFLIPNIVVEGGAMGIGGGALDPNQISMTYKEMFQNLVVIQGFFSGLAIGKMSTGSIVAGLQHVVVLVFAGYISFFVFM